MSYESEYVVCPNGHRRATLTASAGVLHVRCLEPDCGAEERITPWCRECGGRDSEHLGWCSRHKETER